ncbi:MAG: hypothetical protein DRI75_01365 [Bacteroidetes bacterium]|nr:MAG: hypothetical protein DRI75_01365 [Bacteroidota bacterium]
MGIKHVESISVSKRFWNVITNGLLIFGIRNRLALIGLDITPYYWVQEEIEECQEPVIKGDPNEYIFRYLNFDEVILIANKVPNRFGRNLINGFKNGQLCIGLEHNNNIAAYMFIELNDFTFNHRTFKLKNNEAYLLNMWTFHSYRGKNLAPYLRYQSYQLLKEQGRHIKYSITDYFNKSSIKFKNKLNSKHLKLFISIELFKKLQWNFVLKKFT